MESYYPTPISPSKTRIGWIGIGLMGSPMASRLLSAGYSLTIYSRSPSKALHLRHQGALLASSPQSLAQSSDIVFTIIGGPPDVRSVILGPTGVLTSLNPGGVTVDMTTSSPSLAREVSKVARSKDCWAVDAPVSGADAGAREGKLAIMAGGDRDIVEWLSPLFQIMGKCTYMGEEGCGQRCKIGNQIVGSANFIGLSEALIFAERAGVVDLGKLLEAMNGGAAGNKIMELFGEKMIERDFRPGGFVEYLVKDFGIGLNFVEEKGDEVVASPGAALWKQLFTGMIANGDGKVGIQGVIAVVERLNGIEK